MERMKTQVELLKECCDIKDAACVRYQKRIAELEKENENLNKHLGEKIDTIQVLIREKYEEKGEKLELLKENKNLNIIIENTKIEQEADRKYIEELEEENKNLKEFKTKREESRFYFKAQMERAEPKTAREAEDLQRAKKLFEKLYREELSCLEEENRILKELIKGAQKILSN